MQAGVVVRAKARAAPRRRSCGCGWEWPDVAQLPSVPSLSARPTRAIFASSTAYEEGQRQAPGDLELTPEAASILGQYQSANRATNSVSVGRSPNLGEFKEITHIEAERAAFEKSWNEYLCAQTEAGMKTMADYDATQGAWHSQLQEPRRVALAWTPTTRTS